MNTSTSFLDAQNINPDLPSYPKIERNESTITPREQEVLHLIAYEYSSKEIASKLFVSYETVNSHRKNIMEKLGVKNTAGMVRVAFERRLLQMAFTLLLLIMGAVDGRLSAQVTNDDHHNWEVQYNFMCARSSDESPSDEWVIRMLALPGDDTNVPDYFSSGSNHQYCVRYENMDPGDCTADQFVSSTWEYEKLTRLSSSGGFIDINFHSWEDDGDDGCPIDSRDDLEAKSLFSIKINDPLNPSNGPDQPFIIFKSEPMFSEDTHTMDIFYGFNWRYQFGESTDPLTFGELPLNDEKSHLNSNRLKDIGPGSNKVLSEGLIYPNVFGQGAGDVYYTFSIPSKSLVTISTDDNLTTSNTQIWLLNSNKGVLDSDINDGSGVTSLISQKELDAGDYYVVVDGFGGGGQFNLKLLRESIPPPPNNDCQGAISLNVSSPCIPLHTDMCGATSPTFAINDVWYSFIPQSQSVLITVTPSATLDIKLDIFKANSNLNSCGDIYGFFNDNGVGENESYRGIGTFDIGQKYLLRMSNMNNADNTDFSICIEQIDHCEEGYTGVNELNLNITESIEYITNESITSSQNINSFHHDPVEVIYKAGPDNDNSVTLLPDFNIAIGEVLTIEFGGCGNN